MKIKAYVSMSYIGCDTEEIYDLEKDLNVTQEEWAAKSEEEKNEFLNDLAQDMLFENTNSGAWVMDEEEEETGQ